MSGGSGSRIGWQMAEIRTAIGFDERHSMDGIDVALVRTDGETVVERGPFLSVTYEPAFATD